MLVSVLLSSLLEVFVRVRARASSQNPERADACLDGIPSVQLHMLEPVCVGKMLTRRLHCAQVSDILSAALKEIRERDAKYDERVRAEWAEINSRADRYPCLSVCLCPFALYMR